MHRPNDTNFDCIRYDPLLMHPLLYLDNLSAAVHGSTLYFWIWSLSSCGFLCIIILLVERWRRSKIFAHAKSVHNCVTTLANLTRSDQSQKLMQWKWNQTAQWTRYGASKAVFWRRSLFYLLLMIVLVLSMMPACGYVLAQVTPSFRCVLLRY